MNKIIIGFSVHSSRAKRRPELVTCDWSSDDGESDSGGSSCDTEDSLSLLRKEICESSTPPQLAYIPPDTVIPCRAPQLVRYKCCTIT